MADHSISVHVDEVIDIIDPNIYGHFAEHLGACIYDGIWVGEKSAIANTNGIRNDVVNALKKISPPIIRWPGGCFADDYHWRDGIGPRGDRPTRINIWWGDAIENNHFGTHEFIEFCRQVGTEPYLVGNLGSGSPTELRNWVEYCNFAGDSTLAWERTSNGASTPFAVKYWGVGNENWGCGGHFSPEDYAGEYNRFVTYLRDFSDTPLYLIACGPSNNDLDWTRRFFDKLHPRVRINGYAAHYYARDWRAITTPFNNETTGTATEYSEVQWYSQLYLGLFMDTLIRQQRAVMDTYDPERKIGLIVDEWGTWHPPAEGRHPGHLWQQNTVRDALVAAMTLDIFNRHADKVVMGNIAQTINVLQAMILTEGDKMLTTPTYHLYDLYQAHQGGQSLRTAIQTDEITFDYKGDAKSIPVLSGSASRKGDILTISVVNSHFDSPVEVIIRLDGASAREVQVSTLTHASLHAYNSFDAPDTVKPSSLSLDSSGGEWTHTLAPGSVNRFTILL